MKFFWSLRLNVGKLSLEWLDEMVSFSTDKYFANETVEDTLQKKKNIEKNWWKNTETQRNIFWQY